MSLFRVPAKRLKTCAAVIGGGAVLAMCALTTIYGQASTPGATVVSKGSMKTGETVTVQYSETMETSEAVPVDKAPPFGGSGS
jgi:hypothetical protein